jgi:Nop14-like family
VLEFLRSSLAVYCDGEKCLPQHSFDRAALRAQALDATIKFPEKVNWASFKSQAASSASSSSSSASKPSVAMLVVPTIQLVKSYLQRYRDQDGLPEMAKPVLSCLDSMSLLHHVEQCVSLRTMLAELVDERVKARHSLRWREAQKDLVNSIMPRFQVEYAFKNETNMDKEKLLLKQLTKQKKRENKVPIAIQLKTHIAINLTLFLQGCRPRTKARLRFPQPREV